MEALAQLSRDIENGDDGEDDGDEVPSPFASFPLNAKTLIVSLTLLPVDVGV